MNSDLPTRIRAFLALADAATPGPWRAHETLGSVYSEGGLIADAQAPTRKAGPLRANMHFIASAPAMAALLRELLPVLEDAEERKTQLHYLNATLRGKNLALDALHYVWCSGGCTKGVHRYGEHQDLTEEIVAKAERNTKRLRNWFEARKMRDSRESR